MFEYTEVSGTNFIQKQSAMKQVVIVVIEKGYKNEIKRNKRKNFENFKVLCWIRL